MIAERTSPRLATAQYLSNLSHRSTKMMRFGRGHGGSENTLDLDKAGMKAVDDLLTHWYFLRSDVCRHGKVLKGDLILISYQEPERVHFQLGKPGQSAEDRAAAGFALLTGPEVVEQFPVRLHWGTATVFVHERVADERADNTDAREL